MFGNTPGMFGNGTNSTNNGMVPSPLNGEPLAFGNAPYGSSGGNGIYGNAYGSANYPGGYGAYGNYAGGNYSGGNYAGGNYAGSYGNNETGYRGYSPYYGNNNGYGLTSTGPVGTAGQAFGPGSQQFNSGTYYNGMYNSAYNTGPYGNNTAPYGVNSYAPSGPGVGNLGYPNPVTPGLYPPSNATDGSTNSYVPQAYNYGIETVPSGPGVGNLGYPNPATSGSYPQSAPTSTSSTFGWF